MKKLLSVILSLSLAFSLCTALFSVQTFAQATAPERVIYGDINGDGVVNTKDLLLLRKSLAGIIQNIDTVTADVYCDYTVNTKDVLTLRKYLANMGVVLGNSYEAQTKNFTDLSDMIITVGRTKRIKTTLRADFTASGFEFTADCEGDITLRQAFVINSGLLGVIIDDDFDNMQNILVDSSTARIKIATGLEKGVHKIRVVKLNEFNIYTGGNQVTFKDITLNGRFLPNRTAEKPLKIEYYGDSLTCGYGNLCTNGTANAASSKYENGMNTFAAFAANKLNAEFSVCAGSGYGIYCGNGGSTSQSVDDMIGKAIFADDAQTSAWDYSFDADIVVITLGTNDTTYARNSKAAIADDLIMAEAKELVDTIRQHNPDCMILWLGGIAGKMSNDYIDVDGVITRLADETENMEFYADMPLSNAGGDGHPTVQQHKVLGDKLVEIITEKFGDKLNLQK